MNFDLDENIINDIEQIGSKYEIDKIILFGSRARGDNKKSSDIDLAIYCDEKIKNHGNIYFELDEINTLLKFDIVFIKDNTDKKLIENIKRDGVVLYERKN